MPNSPNLGLLMMAASQAQKETVFNNFLIAMDALFKGSVIDVTLNTPPGSASLGDAYVIATGGTGAWSGNDGKIAVYFNGWQFFGASNGMILYSTTQGNYYVYKSGTGWQATPTIAVTDLTDLNDVSAGSATDSQVLAYKAADSKWEPLTLSLTLMSDVNVTEDSGIDGWVLAWRNSAAKWEAAQLATVAVSGDYSDLSGKPTIPTNGSFNMASLGDVQITSLVTGEVPQWNGSKWVNASVSGGGGSALTVSNNGTVVDSAATTLNFVNATSITTLAHDVTITLPTGGGGGGGSPYVGGTHPAIVQVGTVQGNNTDPSVTMGAAPTNGNLLVAIVFNSGSNPTVGSGWTTLTTNYVGNVGVSIFYKTAGASESTTQTPSTGASGNTSTVIWEVSGASGGSGSFSFYQTFGQTPQVISASTNSLPVVAGTLFLAGLAGATNTVVGSYGANSMALLTGSGAPTAYGSGDCTNSQAYGMGVKFNSASSPGWGVVIIA